MAHATKVWDKGNSTPVVKTDTMSDEYVLVQSLMDATVKLTGTVSGKQYVFHGAGSIVKVDIRDKDDIINKKRGRACCSGTQGHNLFQLVT